MSTVTAPRVCPTVTVSSLTGPAAGRQRDSDSESDAVGASESGPGVPRAEAELEYKLTVTGRSDSESGAQAVTEARALRLPGELNLCRHHDALRLARASAGGPPRRTAAASDSPSRIGRIESVGLDPRRAGRPGDRQALRRELSSVSCQVAARSCRVCQWNKLHPSHGPSRNPFRVESRRKANVTVRDGEIQVSQSSSI